LTTPLQCVAGGPAASAAKATVARAPRGRLRQSAGRLGRTIRAMPAQRKAAGTGLQFLQVQTTTDSRAEAVELAQAAVAARLAACAQVAGPISTSYWWEDSIQRSEEWLVMLKLPDDRYDDLAEFLAERHSYDEPEIVATPIVAGSPSYLDWLAEETRPQ
jgi:periplasmic divalent cation tolerance protein